MNLPPFETHYPLWKLEELRKAGVPLEERLELVLQHLQAVDPDSVPKDLEGFLARVTNKEVEEEIPRVEVTARVMSAEGFLEQERKALEEGSPAGESAAQAVELLKTVPTHQRSNAWIARAAQAHALVGNSFRIRGELSAAADEILIARTLLRLTDDIDPVARIDVDNRTATLRRDEMRYPEAAYLFSRARSTALAISRRDLEVRALIGESIVLAYAGRHSQAANMMKAAHRRLDNTTEALEPFVSLNLVLYSTSAGDLRGAKEALARLLQIAAETQNPSLLLRCRWIEARYRSAAGENERARELYENVLAGFADLDRPYDLVLAALDYAVFLRLLPDTDRIKALATEVEPSLDRAPLIAERADEILTALKTGLQTTDDFRTLSNAKLSIERGERPSD